MNTDTPLRFVVPVDGTPQASQAIPFAQALAAPPAEITLVEVLPEAQPERTLLGAVAVDAGTVQRHQTSTARAELEAEADRIRVDSPWITVAIETVVGEPVEGIVRVARERRADCVVIAHTHQGLLERIAIGSVTDGLIKAGAVSVLVVRPRGGEAGLAPPDLRRIVVPLDGSETAARAIPVAERLAAGTQLPVRIVTVARAGDPVPPAVERQREQLADRGVSVSLERLTGDVEWAIEHAVLPDDLLVIGSHHGTGVAAWLARGIAERLVHHASCPVLVVHPAASG